jgi:hypothetical protein
MPAPNVAVTTSIQNGKCEIITTTSYQVTNPDSSTSTRTEVNTSKAFTKAELGQVANQTQGQITQLTAQLAIANARATAIATALADTSLV